MHKAKTFARIHEHTLLSGKSTTLCLCFRQAGRARGMLLTLSIKLISSIVLNIPGSTHLTKPSSPALIISALLRALCLPALSRRWADELNNTWCPKITSVTPLPTLHDVETGRKNGRRDEIDGLKFGNNENGNDKENFNTLTFFLRLFPYSLPLFLLASLAH